MVEYRLLWGFRYLTREAGNGTDVGDLERPLEIRVLLIPLRSTIEKHQEP